MAKKKNKKSQNIVIPELFAKWKYKSMPKCIIHTNDYSKQPLNTKRRDFVLKRWGYKSYKEYLKSDLWKSIRIKVLKKYNNLCYCGCNRQANQVHHKGYTEANLLGFCIKSLVPLYKDCHYNIEFENNEKNTLYKANNKLRREIKENGEMIEKIMKNC